MPRTTSEITTRRREMPGPASAAPFVDGRTIRGLRSADHRPTLSSTTIVFTTTLTKLVGTIADSLSNASPSLLREVKIQSAVVVSYLFGALLSGSLIIRGTSLVAALPLIGVAAAFVVHLRFRPNED